MRIVLAGALALLASPGAYAGTPAEQLDRLTRGRTAGAPVNCIRPDGVVPPEIIDRQAIVYRGGSTVYVVKPSGECPELREGAQIQTRSVGGLLCRGSQFRLAFPPGPSGSGICAFGPFVPYRKAR